MGPQYDPATSRPHLGHDEQRALPRDHVELEMPEPEVARQEVEPEDEETVCDRELGALAELGAGHVPPVFVAGPQFSAVDSAARRAGGRAAARVERGAALDAVGAREALVGGAERVHELRAREPVRAVAEGSAAVCVPLMSAQRHEQYTVWSFVRSVHCGWTVSPVMASTGLPLTSGPVTALGCPA